MIMVPLTVMPLRRIMGRLATSTRGGSARQKRAGREGRTPV
jgi:hypothetical protein